MVETSGIACPACGATDASDVKDSRSQPGGWRRRRVCACGSRFTTMEAVIGDEPVVFERVVTQGGSSIRPRSLTAGEVDHALLAERIAEAVQRVLAS